jgi:hypothetical protein
MAEWTGLEPIKNITKQQRDLMRSESEHHSLGETGLVDSPRLFYPFAIN